MAIREVKDLLQKLQVKLLQHLKEESVEYYEEVSEVSEVEINKPKAKAKTNWKNKYKDSNQKKIVFMLIYQIKVVLKKNL